MTPPYVNVVLVLGEIVPAAVNAIPRLLFNVKVAVVANVPPPVLNVILPGVADPGAAPKLASAEILNVPPPLIVVVPLYVFVPLNVKVLTLFKVIEPVLLITPPNVVFPVFVVVNVKEFKLIVPFSVKLFDPPIVAFPPNVMAFEIVMPLLFAKMAEVALPKINVPNPTGPLTPTTLLLPKLNGPSPTFVLPL
jgi:hypothetical protein